MQGRKVAEAPKGLRKITTERSLQLRELNFLFIFFLLGWKAFEGWRAGGRVVLWTMYYPDRTRCTRLTPMSRSPKTPGRTGSVPSKWYTWFWTGFQVGRVSTLVPSFMTEQETGLDTWSHIFYLVPARPYLEDSWRILVTALPGGQLEDPGDGPTCQLEERVLQLLLLLEDREEVTLLPGPTHPTTCTALHCTAP